jgi:glycosyltransferase involved in cell wall biosynthesis
MSNPIHICIITSAHPVDDVRVSHKISQAFRSKGYHVTWVGPEHASFDSDHYDRYGIEYRLFSLGKGKLGRITGYFKAYHSALAIRNVQVFYAPDPDSALAAVQLARKYNAHVIFDIHEIYHDAMLVRWLKGPVFKIARDILRRAIFEICSNSDLVVGVSRSVLEPYRATSTEKMIIRSCAPAWFAEGEPANVCADEKKTFTFMHGKAHLWRGTQVVLEALSLAKKQIQSVHLRCIMIDIGFSDEFHQQIVALDLEDIVDLRHAVPMQEIPAILRTCDAGLIAYGRKLGTDSLPNRLFEYMATGLPIIAPSYSSEICQILEIEECGLTVDFENPVAVADAMIHLCQNPQLCREMGHKSRDAFEKRHNWEVEVQPLLDRIQSWYPDLE